MDFAAAFTHISQDQEWIKKLAIASVLALLAPLLGITMLPLVGWMLEITRRVANGEQQTLPAWDNFGRYFADGFKAAVLMFVWVLPLALIVACLVGLGAVAGSQMRDQNNAAMAVLVTNICTFILVIPYSLLLGILAPAAMATLAVTGELGAAINPSNALRLVRAGIGTYVIVWLINAFLPGVLTSIGSVVCGIGAAVGIAYGFTVLGHLYGQAYRLAGSGAAPLEAGAG